jgi:tRNA pseudouridine38-40 synthase
VNAPESVRFALTIHYDGAPFHGWQLQPDAPTVQGELERVVAHMTGGTRIPVTGSGRTDRGVHATGQVAALELPPRWTSRELRKGLNALLPRAIWIQEARRVPSSFHPRFDARRRTYGYQVGTTPLARSPFLQPYCWSSDHLPPREDLLHAAAALLPGDRSWKPFAQAGQEERGYRCQVLQAAWSPWHGGGGERLGWHFQITANRYLHHMVRYLVGTMMAVARGHRPLEELEALLEDPSTSLVTSPPAPPQGLFLSRVEYDDGALGRDPDQDPEPRSSPGAPPALPPTAPPSTPSWHEAAP